MADTRRKTGQHARHSQIEDSFSQAGAGSEKEVGLAQTVVSSALVNQEKTTNDDGYR